MNSMALWETMLYCNINATSLDAAKLTVAIIDLFRSLNIQGSPKMRALVVSAALINVLDAIAFYHLAIVTFYASDGSRGDMIELVKPAIVFAAITAPLSSIMVPLLYNSRYDALIDNKALAWGLKLSWLVPIGFRLGASIQFLIPAMQQPTFDALFQKVIFTQVAADVSAVHVGTEMFLVILSDCIILYRMHTIAAQLNRPFFKLIGLTRLLRLTVFCVFAIVAAFYPLIAQGHDNLSCFTACVQALSWGIAFSILLDFFELDMGAFRAPNPHSGSGLSSPKRAGPERSLIGNPQPADLSAVKVF